MTKFEKVLLIIAILIFLCAIGFAIGYAQVTPKPSFKPTELQTLRLQLKQRDAQIAQKDLFIAQQNFQAALKLLNDEAEKVKSENSWPKETGFDANALTFAEGPKTDPPDTGKKLKGEVK